MTVKLGHHRGRKVSIEKERELVALYISKGLKASEAACRALGLSPRYAASSAFVSGLRRPGTRGHSTGEDPRWARAIENGPITI